MKINLFAILSKCQVYKTFTMGAYLSTPNVDKESEDNEGGNIRYGASSMQGWRVSQEV